MDVRDPNRFRHRKSTSSERFLGVFPNTTPLSDNQSSSSSTNGVDEFNEDDVVFLTGDHSEPTHSSTPSSSTSSTPRHRLHHHHHHNNQKPFGLGSSDSFGILAALPENEESPNARNGSHLFHKASVSSSASSSSTSSRLIPAIPKPPTDRFGAHSTMSSLRYHQSAPVNVPILSQAMMNGRVRRSEFDEDDVGDDNDDEEMLPPHEIVARNSAQSPMLACSVLEGAGRTLKGRDLRQVRNAVWRQTGFLD